MTLNEGLRANDLRGMIQNIVSIDEYQSKIDERAIVIAFYVADLHAAKDLTRFIQKSHVLLLDTELSAAPDQKGNYLVFVELPMNDKTASSVSQLCLDVNSIGAISKWVVSVRGNVPSKPASAKEVENIINDSLHFALDEFLSSSDLNHLTLVESIWHARTANDSLLFRVDDFGSFEQVVNRNKLKEQAINLSPEALRTAKHVRSMLGNAWTVDCLGDRFAVYCEDSNDLMLITKQSV
jgi:hypothetical protein